MKIVVIACDGVKPDGGNCQCVETGQSYSTLIHKLRRAGWVKVRKGKQWIYLCPDCIAIENATLLG